MVVYFPEAKEMPIVKYLIVLNLAKENIAILVKLVYGILGKNLLMKSPPLENVLVQQYY